MAKKKSSTATAIRNKAKKLEYQHLKLELFITEDWLHIEQAVIEKV